MSTRRVEVSVRLAYVVMASEYDAQWRKSIELVIGGEMAPFACRHKQRIEGAVFSTQRRAGQAKL